MGRCSPLDNWRPGPSDHCSRQDPEERRASVRLCPRGRPTNKLTCRYEAQRNSGRVQRFVRFCCYVQKLLLLFFGRVLLQDTGERQEPHLTCNVYL